MVAEVLRRCPYLELVPMPLDGLTLHPGLTRWPLLDEVGAPVDSDNVEQLPFFDPAHLDPATRLERGEAEEGVENAILDQLPHCLRLWHDDNNTGGFFVAQFRHKSEASPENVAQAFRSRRATDEPKAGPQPSSLRQNQPPIPWSSLKTVLYIIWRRCTEWH